MRNPTIHIYYRKHLKHKYHLTLESTDGKNGLKFWVLPHAEKICNDSSKTPSCNNPILDQIDSSNSSVNPLLPTVV